MQLVVLTTERAVSRMQRLKMLRNQELADIINQHLVFTKTQPHVSMPTTSITRGRRIYPTVSGLKARAIRNTASERRKSSSRRNLNHYPPMTMKNLTKAARRGSSRSNQSQTRIKRAGKEEILTSRIKGIRTNIRACLLSQRTLRTTKVFKIRSSRETSSPEISVSTPSSETEPMSLSMD